MVTNRHKNILFDFLTQPAFRLWRHLVFIVAFFPIGLSQSFFVFDGYAQIPTSTLYGFGICLALTIIAFVYVNIYVLAARFLPRGEYASYAFSLFLLVSAFVFVKYIAEYWIFSGAGIIRELNGVTVLDGLSNLMLYTICIASGSITILFKRWIADHAVIDNLESKQLKNNIEEIKNRIHPKFLSATLDYAAEKVKSEPEQTSETLFALSELLRYQLYDSKRDQVLFESDIQFIRNYLILERQNSENRLSFTISATGARNRFIPSSLFIPWIEEITSQHPTTLDVKFAIDDRLISFGCKVSGMGLSRCDFSKIEHRQKLLYGDNIRIVKRSSSLELQLKLC